MKILFGFVKTRRDIPLCPVPTFDGLGIERSRLNQTPRPARAAFCGSNDHIEKVFLEFVHQSSIFSV